MSIGHYVLAVLLFCAGFATAVIVARAFPQKFCNILLFLIAVGSLDLWWNLLRSPNVLFLWKYVASLAEGFVFVAITAVHGYADDYWTAVKKLNKILEE